MTKSTPDRNLALAGHAPLTAAGPHVLCLTPTDPPTEAAFAQAFEIAGPDGVVVLYDRRDESWRPDDDAVLASARDEAFVDIDDVRRARTLAKGYDADLAVWRSITPALGTGVLQAVQSADITDIVVPAEGHQSAAGDRIISDDDSVAGAIADLLAKPVVTDTGHSPQLHVVGVDA